MSSAAPDVRSLNPDVPPALAAVVARALERHPNDRYQTARALRSDLARLAVGDSDHLPTTSMDVPARRRPWWRPLRRPIVDRSPDKDVDPTRVRPDDDDIVIWEIHNNCPNTP